MSTTNIGGLKVRHSPTSNKSYSQKYYCGLNEAAMELLKENITEVLIFDLSLMNYQLSPMLSGHGNGHSYIILQPMLIL